LDEIESLYLLYQGQKQTTTPLSKAVVYLGYFPLFGDMMPRRYVYFWNKLATPPEERRLHGPQFRSRAFQEQALDAALASLKDCVILSTTASYFSQFQNACLLKSRGFELLEGSCYKHPGYSMPSGAFYNHPGIPDGYQHWEHIWFKVQGPDGPKEIGQPVGTPPGLNNCGVDGLVGLDNIKRHDGSTCITANNPNEYQNRMNYLSVAWLPRGVLFPKGWKRFFSAEDYKLGVNFGTLEGRSKVQKCPHNFDLKIFDDWEPDFERWNPS
jgi:hypothetical protein